MSIVHSNEAITKAPKRLQLIRFIFQESLERPYYSAAI